MKTRKHFGLLVVLLGLALALPPRFTPANAGPAPAAGTRIVYYGSDGDDTQVDLGTPDPDTILQYGRAGNDTLYIAGQAHNDGLEQEGGDGQDNLSIKGGDGDDHIAQSGGNGGDTQFIRHYRDLVLTNLSLIPILATLPNQLMQGASCNGQLQ